MKYRKKMIKRNIKTKTFIGLTSTVLGLSILYIAGFNKLNTSASGLIASNPAADIVIISIGAFLLVLGSIVLLFVFASK